MVLHVVVRTDPCARLIAAHAECSQAALEGMPDVTVLLTQNQKKV